MTITEAAHSGCDENPSAGDQPDASVVVRAERPCEPTDHVGKNPTTDRVESTGTESATHWGSTMRGEIAFDARAIRQGTESQITLEDACEGRARWRGGER